MKTNGMTTAEGIKAILSEHKQELQLEYHVKELGIFGSYARGDQSPESDVDILVTFDAPIGLQFVDLAEYLEKLLSMKVDLVSRGAIKPTLRKYIEEEILYV